VSNGVADEQKRKLAPRFDENHSILLQFRFDFEEFASIRLFCCTATPPIQVDASRSLQPAQSENFPHSIYSSRPARPKMIKRIARQTPELQIHVIPFYMASG
jgi:hypothetical protein